MVEPLKTSNLTGISVWQVDAFTDRPFQGNPAGVCLLGRPLDDDLMSSLAREMNLSETAFLFPEADGYRLRWFTPEVEVDLCGHATLGAAHVLWTEGYLARDQTARFHTRSGLLSARLEAEGWIELDFPVKPAAGVPLPEGLAEALGVRPLTVCRSQFDYLIELESGPTVQDLRPDFSLLEKVEARGIIVTSRAESGDLDFVSRFFAPAVGINEDPVTGSAHCTLVPFWAERLKKKEMTARQLSARGGLLRLRLVGDRVIIAGQAVTVMKGMWL